MVDYARLEKGVMDFIRDSRLESFDAEELAEELCGEKASKEDRETALRRILGILDSCESVARKHSSDLFYILENFFRGTVFYCKPREIELERGILIPGARFEPFHSRELYATDLELFRPHAKKPFELLTETFRYGEISDLFFMMGPAGTMDTLTAESQQNYEMLRHIGSLSPSMNVELEVFDLSDFYRETEFRPGDLIKFEIISRDNGQMKLSHVSRVDSPDPRETDAWIDKFEDALTDVCFDFKDSLEIHEQMMYAYLYAAASGNDIRKRPSPPIDLYHKMMHSISFRRDGSEWVLISNDQLDEQGTELPREHSHSSCGCGHDHHDHEESNGQGDFGDLTPDDFSISQGTMESIDAILASIHAPVHETEIHAYMLDTIANGAEDFSEFERIHENLVKFIFMDEAQEAAYLNFIEDLWDRTFELYSHNIDSRKAPLRARLLELTDSRIELSSAILAHRNNPFPQEYRDRLVKIHKDVLDTLFILNRDALPEDSEFDDLELRVGDIEDEYDIISEKALEWLDKQITDGK